MTPKILEQDPDLKAKIDSYRSGLSTYREMVKTNIAFYENRESEINDLLTSEIKVKYIGEKYGEAQIKLNSLELEIKSLRESDQEMRRTLENTTQAYSIKIKQLISELEGEKSKNMTQTRLLKNSERKNRRLEERITSYIRKVEFLKLQNAKKEEHFKKNLNEFNTLNEESASKIDSLLKRLEEENQKSTISLPPCQEIEEVLPISQRVIISLLQQEKDEITNKYDALNELQESSNNQIIELKNRLSTAECLLREKEAEFNKKELDLIQKLCAEKKLKVSLENKVKQSKEEISHLVRKILNLISDKKLRRKKVSKKIKELVQKNCNEDTESKSSPKEIITITIDD